MQSNKHPNRNAPSSPRRALRVLSVIASALLLTLLALLVYRAYRAPQAKAPLAVQAATEPPHAAALTPAPTDAPAVAPADTAMPLATETPLPSPVPSAFDLNELILAGKKRAYSHSELAGMTAYELSILRNGMFALSGKRFTKNSEVAVFFSACDWYTPLYDSDAETLRHMNESQLANVELIVSVEKEFGYR